MLLLLISNGLFAIIDYNDNCKKSFEYTYALNNKVDSLLNIERKVNPNNSVINYISTYSLFMKYVSTGESKFFKQFEDQQSIAIDIIEEEDDNDPYKKYFLSDLYLLETIGHAIQKSYLSAVYSFKKSYRINAENIEAFPNFLPNYKTKGAMAIAIGSIPKDYNWGLSILGLSGNIDQGFKDITKALIDSKNNKSKNYLFVENLLIYTFLSDNFAINNKDNKVLINIFNSDIYNNKYSDNLMYIFSKASFYQHHKQNNKVIETLEIVKNKNTEVSKRFCYFNYQYGLSLLYTKSLLATSYFQKYINTYPSNNYKASSYQKLAWTGLINGDSSSYLSYMSTIRQMDNLFYDSDKQAKKEAESEEVPNVYLLEGRLLFDGGYYQEAINTLEKGKQLSSYTRKRDKVEYIYRLGRIYDEKNDFIKAEKYYLLTIERAKDLKYFYAAKSALQLGYNYEEKGKFKDAAKMYKLILELDFDEYQNGITQKAKAGLGRVQQ